MRFKHFAFAPVTDPTQKEQLQGIVTTANAFVDSLNNLNLPTGDPEGTIIYSGLCTSVWGAHAHITGVGTTRGARG